MLSSCEVRGEERISAIAMPSCTNRQSSKSITSSVLPARPPPLLPLVAVKHFLPKFHVDRVVSLAHPPSKLVSVADFWLVAILHPRSEVVCAYPTRV